jgi:hypothetical protein
MLMRVQVRITYEDAGMMVMLMMLIMAMFMLIPNGFLFMLMLMPVCQRYACACKIEA